MYGIGDIIEEVQGEWRNAPLALWTRLVLWTSTRFKVGALGSKGHLEDNARMWLECLMLTTCESLLGTTLEIGNNKTEISADGRKNRVSDIRSIGGTRMMTWVEVSSWKRNDMSEAVTRMEEDQM